ncbi:MAG: STAS domain-containing protein [Ignavibacteriaceae bacterium]|nr:STAS domain-containing protein [Ignavibacteriaceae bacterium]
MFFRMEAEGNVTEIYVQGDLTAATLPEFRNTVEPFLTGYQRPIVLDFTEVNFISSAGIRAILLLYRTAMEAAPKYNLHFMDMIKFRNLSPHVDQIFDISGLNDSIIQWMRERDEFHANK